MIKRTLAKKLRAASKNYPIVAVVGPRQSGKTTLVKMVFPDYNYISLEKPSDLEYALTDAEGFLSQFPKGVIIDEIQRAPQLFSYLQTIVDQKQKEGLYILTGSQNFGLLEKIGQSLAGRISIQKLLPFTLEELKQAKKLPGRLADLLYTGGYPRIYDKHLNPTDWLSNYVAAYLERDVRSLKQVGDLSTFQRFIKMCAFRSGKILNLSSLANDCGITHNTAKAWISVLQASFIVFLLNPYYKNFNKRLIKSPKLYFYDVGLLCYLMGIAGSKDLHLHPEIGSIFETFAISEVQKSLTHHGTHKDLYFWRDKSGREIDGIIESAQKNISIEIKAGQTISSQYFDNLTFWSKLSHSKPSDSYLIYAGKENQKRSNCQVLRWSDMDSIPLG
ncbi:MAG: ATP-binding protein [Candidatus Margulisiibacteriota bacterium]